MNMCGHKTYFIRLPLVVYLEKEMCKVVYSENIFVCTIMHDMHGRAVVACIDCGRGIYTVYIYNIGVQKSCEPPVRSMHVYVLYAFRAWPATGSVRIGICMLYKTYCLFGNFWCLYMCIYDRYENFEKIFM